MSNLLKDASILLTPTAYDNGRMLSIKPSKDLYGLELITNGDFSNGSNDWTLANVDFSVGAVLFDNNNDNIFQSFSDTVNTVYKLTITKTGAGTLRLRTGFAGSDATKIDIPESGIVYFKATANTNRIQIYGDLGSVSATLNSVSVKEDLSGDFQFSRNSAATRVNAQGLVENVQILSGDLVQNGSFSQIGAEEVTNGSFSQEGAELITNGDFATDSDWTIEANWTIENGVANGNGANGSSEEITQAITPFVIGKTYKIVYDVLNYVSGSIRFLLSGDTGFSGTIRNSNGTYTEYVRAIGANTRFKLRGGVFNGSIDNVSIKEVGQDWTLGTGWSIGDDKAVADILGNVDLRQSAVFEIGKSYKVSIQTLESNSGVLRFVNGSTIIGEVTSVNTHVFYLEAEAVNFVLTSSSAGFNGSVTNISVKEVGQNWTFGDGFTPDEVNSKATCDGTQSAATNLTQTISTNIQNKLVRVSFTLDYTAGVLLGSLSGTGALDFNNITSSGTYTAEMTSNEVSPPLILQGDANFIGSITNIVLLEVTNDTNLPRINYEGFSYQDALGSELVTNGDFSNGSTGWASGNWVIANSEATINPTSNGYKRLGQNNILTIGKQYRVVANVVTKSGGTLLILNNFTGSIYQTLSVGETVWNFTASSDNIGFEFTGVGETAVVSSLSVKEYFGQEVVPDSGCGSWLLEPQSTNLTPYSEDFTQSWTPTGLAITSNSIASPSGEINSDKWVEDTSNGPHNIRNNPNLPVTNGAEYTMSIFAKAGERTGLRFANAAESNAEGRFDLSNGTVTFTGTNTTFVGIEDYGNGWYRCIISFTASTTIAQLNLRLMDGSSLSYQGDGTSGLYAWGAQLENQSYATSYIPTSGASSTRLGDLATDSGNSTLINSTEGVLYAEISSLADSIGDSAVSLNNSTSSNRVWLGYSTAANKIWSIGYSSGDVQFVLSHNLTTDTEMIKTAVKYKDNDFALWLNGTEVATDNSGVSPQTLNNLSFDMNGNGVGKFYGKTKAIAVYKEALTDANLRCLTYPPAVATTFDLNFNTIATDFTFTRGSEATFVNAQGLIQSTNEIGPELVTNGDFSNGSTDWILDANWSIGDDKAISDGATGFIRTSASVFESGKTYKVGLTVSNMTTGRVTYPYDGSGSTPILSNGTFSQIYTPDNTNKCWIYAKSGFDGSIDNVSVKEYTTATNTPRLDYSTGAEAFLLEPQRTNLIPYSNDFSVSSWNKQVGIIPTYNTTETLSPDGTYNATKFIGNGSTGVFKASIVESGVVSRSVYLKSVTGTTTATFKDPNTGVPSSIPLTITNEWQRFELIGDNGSGFQGLWIDDITSDGIYMWGAQLELGSYATSYIPTSGASATRNQELCNNATPVINSTEGVLYAEIKGLVDGGANRFITLGDGTANNSIGLYLNLALGRITVEIRSSGSSNQYLNYSSATQTDMNKIAVSYKDNDCQLWINGVKVAFSTTALAPIALNKINFATSTGSQSFFGNTKGLKYYPKALADVQLEDLTTI